MLSVWVVDYMALGAPPRMEGVVDGTLDAPLGSRFVLWEREAARAEPGILKVSEMIGACFTVGSLWIDSRRSLAS